MANRSMVPEMLYLMTVELLVLFSSSANSFSHESHFSAKRMLYLICGRRLHFSKLIDFETFNTSPLIVGSIVIVYIVSQWPSRVF